MPEVSNIYFGAVVVCLIIIFALLIYYYYDDKKQLRCLYRKNQIYKATKIESKFKKIIRTSRNGFIKGAAIGLITSGSMSAIIGGGIVFAMLNPITEAFEMESSMDDKLLNPELYNKANL